MGVGVGCGHTGSGYVRKSLIFNVVGVWLCELLVFFLHDFFKLVILSFNQLKNQDSFYKF